MNLPSSEEPLNPDDLPLYYPPRSLRSKANLQSNSTPQTPSVHRTSSRSQFDEMMEKAMANSRRRSLELDYERDERRPLLKVISRVAAVIGVTAIVGLVFFTLIPKFSRASDPPTLAASEVQTMDASVGAAKVASEESQAVLQKFVEFQKSQESNKPNDDVSRSTLGGTAKVMPGKSQALLEKFMQWKQRQQPPFHSRELSTSSNCSGSGLAQADLYVCLAL